jgi:hypothetical protein
VVEAVAMSHYDLRRFGALLQRKGATADAQFEGLASGAEPAAQTSAKAGAVRAAACKQSSTQRCPGRIQTYLHLQSYSCSLGQVLFRLSFSKVEDATVCVGLVYF